MIALDRFRDALTARNCNPRGTAARCPAHDDRRPSLSFGPASQFPGVVVNCQAGCPIDDILAALGLTRADLFDEPRQAKQGRAVVAEYPYFDEAGTVLYVKQRYWPKDFLQYVPLPDGGKQWSLSGVRRVLYRLPEVKAAIAESRSVFVAEGEKDADALVAAGVVATCNTEGAAKPGQTAKWRKDYTEQLRGAMVTVIADKDDTGMAHAKHIVKELTGVAAHVRLVEPLSGKDAFDHLQAGWRVDECVEVFDQLQADDNAVEPEGRRLKVTRASDITMKATRWLWEEYGTRWMPYGAVALLGGREGVGKSTTSYDLVAKITRGALPGHLYGQPKSVVVCATEDAWAETIVPKLVAAKADLDRVLRVDSVSPEGFEGALSLPADVQRLKQLIGEEDVAFVLLDPLLSTLDIKLDSHKDAEVRMALEPLSRLAHDSQVSMLGLIHENKSNAADLLTRIMGSRAFTAVVRAVLYCARHEDEPEDSVWDHDRYVLGQLKSNLGPRARFGIKYHIESELVGHDEDLDLPIWNSKVVWDGLTDESIQDIVTAQEKRRAKSPNVESAQGKAEKWLKAYLSKHGPTPSKKVKAMAGRDSHSEASVKRAAEAMDVLITKIPNTRNETTWELSTPPTTPTPLVELSELTDLTELTEPTEPVNRGVGS